MDRRLEGEKAEVGGQTTENRRQTTEDPSSLFELRRGKRRIDDG